MSTLGLIHVPAKGAQIGREEAVRHLEDAIYHGPGFMNHVRITLRSMVLAHWPKGQYCTFDVCTFSRDEHEGVSLAPACLFHDIACWLVSEFGAPQEVRDDADIQFCVDIYHLTGDADFALSRLAGVRVGAHAGLDDGFTGTLPDPQDGG